jgi:hypothetical protein
LFNIVENSALVTGLSGLNVPSLYPDTNPKSYAFSIHFFAQWLPMSENETDVFAGSASMAVLMLSVTFSVS